VGAAAQREGTDPVSATAARARVLVVDDQPIICSMLRRELQGRFVVDVAANGAEAVARIREGGDYALILCDLMMPEVTGFDVLDVIEREAPHLLSRVVVMTGRVCRGDELHRLMELSVNVLHKPFGSGDLLTIVLGYLSAHAARR
jgi:CheY-like chemotaxis protein